MADAAGREPTVTIANPICDVCGFEIEEPDQQCPALDDGRCRP